MKIKRLAQNKYLLDYRDAEKVRHREVFHGRREDAVEHSLSLLALRQKGKTQADVDAEQEALERAAISLGDFVDQWRDVKYPSITDNTIGCYEGALNAHILPHFKDTPLRDIDQDSVQAFVNLVHRKPKDPRTVELSFVVLSMILRYGAQKGLCNLVVRQTRGMPGVMLPKKTTPEIDAPTIEQVMDAAGRVHPQYRALVLFVGLVSTRQSEAFAIYPEVIDWDNNRVRIKRTVEKRTHRVVEMNKTTKSRRWVSCPDIVMEALREHLQSWPAEHGSPVFTTPRGRLLNSSHFWHDVWKPLGVSFTFRDMRHTAATYLAEIAGWTIKDVQEHYGHSSPAFTIQRYQGKFDKTNEVARGKMNDALHSEIQKLESYYRQHPRGESRTPTPSRADDFESPASSIPPPGGLS